ncbi:DUF4113 domain-containing protein [Salmonella enterica]|nr:DUF4113 domain-containing protein [Salmonella enterica]
MEQIKCVTTTAKRHQKLASRCTGKQMKRDTLSPDSTTSWDALPVIMF